MLKALRALSEISMKIPLDSHLVFFKYQEEPVQISWRMFCGYLYSYFFKDESGTTAQKKAVALKLLEYAVLNDRLPEQAEAEKLRQEILINWGR